MSQVWSGNISTDDPTACIHGNARPMMQLRLTDHHLDIHIWTSNSSTRVPFSQDAKLHFLSLVEVARIPLYFAAGPSCNVSTGNEATTTWLTEALLNYEESGLRRDASREPWWSQSGRQSEDGILLKVDNENEEERGITNGITEVLLYAAVSKTDTAVPTPPASSSPQPPDEYLEDTLNPDIKTVKVFALPLCSKFMGPAKKSMEVCLPSPRELQSAEQAFFLPCTHEAAHVTNAVPQKRQSISTLFEDATTKRRKFKGRGGESISQAMAGIDRLPSRHELRDKQEAPQPQQDDLRRRSLTRASSMTSVAGSEYSRPTSRSGPLANGKRSSLHRVESAISPRDSPTPSDADGSCLQQNKAALTKVIMTAMRLHGLQQKNKAPSKSQLSDQVTLHNEINVAANEAEDEYKLVYHQTFKAAMLTFRKHLNALRISQETMRDVVDRLLIMFCTDPMIEDRVPYGNDLEESEVNNGLAASNPFDKPSSQARFSNVASGWNIP
ncbi:hypothetical protein IMSHALPRED_003936 [Imshaugia aleurites]|uniref:Sld7 C-terminal domain-containing protein n=1 Tax=Imshaugia aleurites TaxID=172621 RepID=A0A8H3EF90_9LECA|nr:hypothetical protein IMSHALPRED_003936 [Imshaugia aleurites]